MAEVGRSVGELQGKAAIMRPAYERKVLDALDSTIASLIDLRPLLELAIARDDQPSSQFHEDSMTTSTDPTSKKIRRLADKVIGIDIAVSSLVRAGKILSKPIEDAQVRVEAIPECIVGPHLALPSPSRGMCQSHYQAWYRSNYHDIADWLRTLPDEDKGKTTA